MRTTYLRSDQGRAVRGSSFGALYAREKRCTGVLMGLTYPLRFAILSNRIWDESASALVPWLSRCPRRKCGRWMDSHG